MEKRTEWFLMHRFSVPADFEQYMERLALEGWNVERIRQWSSVRMVFRRTQPKRYRYVFDLNAFPGRDYRATYESFGWEYAGRMSSCVVWRQEYEGERPESFTDAKSIAQRSGRVRNAVGVSFLIFLIGALSFGVRLTRYYDGLAQSDRVQLGVLTALFLVISIYLGCVMLRVHRNRRR